MATLRSNVGDINPVSLPSDPALSAFHADMVAVEVELADRAALDAELAEINQWDSLHCRQCGRVTAGSDIAGCHVQACDSCIVQWVQDQIGAQVI